MHSIWRGTLSFALVNIGVKLYPASKERDLKFKLLHKKDLSEVGYKHFCKAEKKEIPWEEIVKGYEYSKGEFVILTEEDFERAYLKDFRTIEILSFVNENEIDPIYFHTPYYLEPENDAKKAFLLLRDALKISKKVAVGNFVFRHHRHLCAIKPYQNILLLNELRYSSDIINSKSLNLPMQKAPVKKELDMAIKLIDELTGHFHPKDYVDTFSAEMKKIIKKKSSGKRVKIEKEVRRSTKVYDIMAELKKSLGEEKKNKRRKAG